LVLLQFCISVGLIVATIVIYSQLQFISNQSLGINRENVILIRLQPGDMTDNYSNLKSTLIQNTNVISVSRSERLIGEPWPSNTITVVGRDPNDLTRVSGNLVGFDYIETMGIKLKEGRTFTEGNPLDSFQTIILNERAVSVLDLDDPVGEQVNFFSIEGPRTVIGVVEDFNFSTLHNEITPMVLIIPFIDLEMMYVRITPGNLVQQIQSIKANWQLAAPDVPMDFKFMDTHLDQLYNAETRLSLMIAIFSFLAILLAGMGLFSLVSFMISGQLKNVAIRKVLGSSIISNLFLLSGRYIKMILLASFISFPVMYFLLNKWLEGFAYRIEIKPWIFILSCLLALSITLLIISRQVLGTARINPARILKSE